MKAVKRLAAADLVLHDALIDPEARALAPKARWFYVGKRAGRESISQETIERLLVRAARRGERVVRLKFGDPFVFGRGGEEALTLAREGVPFEVIPGVSSAIAAPRRAAFPSRTGDSPPHSASFRATPRAPTPRSSTRSHPAPPRSSC